MKIQKYLICDELVKEEQILLFSLRSLSFPVKSNFSYMHKNDMSCRACSEPETVESEEHFCTSCVNFQSERNFKTLVFSDIYGTLDLQVQFIKQFKIIARKWKVLLEFGLSTISMDPPAPC